MNKKLLIIEDQKAFVKPLLKQLKKYNYDVTVRENITEGLEVINQESFDLILCDFQTPKGDFVDLASNDKILNQKPKIVLMSGYLQSDLEEKIEKIVNNLKENDIEFSFLKKPFSLKDLKKEVV